MDRMGAEEGEVITHPLISRSIGSAQQRVELQNFEARKRLLDYDDVMNQQREVIYDLRTFALEGGEDLKGEVWDMVEKAIDRLLDEYAPAGEHAEEWALAELRQRLLMDFFLDAQRLPKEEGEAIEFRNRAELEEYLGELARAQFQVKMEHFGPHADELMRFIVLSTIDEKWKDHLYDLDHLKASIGFRGWGQKDPLIEYKKEAYDMFVDLMTDVTSSIAKLVFRAQIQLQMAPPPQFFGYPEIEEMPPEVAAELEEAPLPPPAPQPRASGIGINPMTAVRAPEPQQTFTNRGEEDARPKQAAAQQTIGRNDPCPCGSGKKYKKCHGAEA
jgi:preprotein translocase subunit SecA